MPTRIPAKRTYPASGRDRRGAGEGPLDQVLRHLAGEWTEQQARDETVRATRRFARRQESWFRRDPRVTWLDAGAPHLVERALAGTGAVPT